jgi:hypothetical protein
MHQNINPSKIKKTLGYARTEVIEYYTFSDMRNVPLGSSGKILVYFWSLKMTRGYWPFGGSFNQGRFWYIFGPSK